MPVPIEVGENTYISVTDATSYFDERLFSDAWSSASDDDKAKALITATKKIDRQPLRGKKADESQTLQFPRALYSYEQPGYNNSFFLGSDGYKKVTSGTGWVYESEVAQCVKDAVCEEALALLDRGNSKRTKLIDQGVTNVSIGHTSESYNKMTAFHAPDKHFLSKEAKLLITHYLAGSVSIC